MRKRGGPLRWATILLVWIGISSIGCFGPDTVYLDDSDDGHTVTLETDQDLVVTLPVHNDFTWSCSITRDGILTANGEEPVAGGQRFRFLARHSGQTTLVLEYRGPSGGIGGYVHYDIVVV